MVTNDNYDNLPQPVLFARVRFTEFIDTLK